MPKIALVLLKSINIPLPSIILFAKFPLNNYFTSFEITNNLIFNLITSSTLIFLFKVSIIPISCFYPFLNPPIYPNF